MLNEYFIQASKQIPHWKGCAHLPHPSGSTIAARCGRVDIYQSHICDAANLEAFAASRGVDWCWPCSDPDRAPADIG